ncbi:MAG: hypothetical protein ACK40L_18095 [Hydrogenophaga sp.]
MRQMTTLSLVAAISIAVAGTIPVARADDTSAMMHAVGVRAAPTLARDTRTPGLTDNIGLSAAQTARLQQVFTRVDNQMKPAMGRHGARAGQMRNELDAISSLPPGAKRDEAVRAYQARHDTFYSDLLRETKVDLPALAREMQAIAPEFQFEVKGRSIVGSQRRLLDPRSNISTPAIRSPLPTTAPRTTTASAPRLATPTTTRLTGFVDEDTRRCHVASSGNNRFTSNSLTSSSFAAVAGGCESSASKSKTFDVPTGTSASLELGYNLRLKAFAAGIVGMGSSNASALVDTGEGRLETRYISAFAPWLWVADTEENVRGVRENVPVQPGTGKVLRFTTRSFSLAILPGGANSSATIDGITASLTVTP